MKKKECILFLYTFYSFPSRSSSDEKSSKSPQLGTPATYIFFASPQSLSSGCGSTFARNNNKKRDQKRTKKQNILCTSRNHPRTLYLPPYPHPSRQPTYRFRKGTRPTEAWYAFVVLYISTGFFFFSEEQRLPV